MRDELLKANIPRRTDELWHQIADLRRGCDFAAPDGINQQAGGQGFAEAANLKLPGIIIAPDTIAHAAWRDERCGDVTVRAFEQRR